MGQTLVRMYERLRSHLVIRKYLGIYCGIIPTSQHGVESRIFVNDDSIIVIIADEHCSLFYANNVIYKKVESSHSAYEEIEIWKSNELFCILYFVKDRPDPNHMSSWTIEHTHYERHTAMLYTPNIKDGLLKDHVILCGKKGEHLGEYVKDSILKDASRIREH